MGWIFGFGFRIPFPRTPSNSNSACTPTKGAPPARAGPPRLSPARGRSCISKRNRIRIRGSAVRRWRAASGAATAERPRISGAATAANASRTAAQSEHPAARDGRGMDGVNRAEPEKDIICEPEKDKDIMRA